MAHRLERTTYASPTTNDGVEFSAPRDR